MSINKFTVMGHLGNDPEIRLMPDGTAVATVSVATNTQYKDKVTGDLKESTDWHRLTAYDKSAEVMRDYCAKGDKVYFEAKHRTRKFPDKETGETRYAEEFMVTFIELTTKKGDYADEHEEADHEPAI